MKLIWIDPQHNKNKFQKIEAEEKVNSSKIILWYTISTSHFILSHLILVISNQHVDLSLRNVLSSFVFLT